MSSGRLRPVQSLLNCWTGLRGSAWPFTQQTSVWYIADSAVNSHLTSSLSGTFWQGCRTCLHERRRFTLHASLFPGLQCRYIVNIHQATFCLLQQLQPACHIVNMQCSCHIKIGWLLYSWLELGETADMQTSCG